VVRARREPSGWVSRGGPDNCPEASNADQTDTDADGIGDACEAPVVSDPVLTDPAPTGASVQGASQPNGARPIRAGAYCSPIPSSGPYSPECVEGVLSEVGMQDPVYAAPGRSRA
jgi:hypothetical protein